MNNFDTIFQAVKEETAVSKSKKKISYEAIARKTSIRVQRVEFYIKCLADMGLIRCLRDHTIQLTDEGKNKTGIFL